MPRRKIAGDEQEGEEDGPAQGEPVRPQDVVYKVPLGVGVYGAGALGKNPAMICTLDTLVALIAAFIIIPAVFATGVEPGKGASFAFVSLAGVFQQMPARCPGCCNGPGRGCRPPR